MRSFCDVLKDNKYGFIAFNVNVYDIAFNSFRNFDTNFGISGCTWFSSKQEMVSKTML